MLLSILLKEFSQNINEFTIWNEKEFSTLGIIASKVRQPMCTFLDSEKFLSELPDNVTMLITTQELGKLVLKTEGVTYGLVIVDKPRHFFFGLHNFLAEKADYCRKIEHTAIDSTAEISTLSYISKINVKIGKRVKIEPFVTIYENSEIGDDCIIRSGAKIGGQGFEFKRTGKEIMSVKHLGGVKIGNNVEIQNNTCIDRAIYPWDDTCIGDYTKIDNLVHIGHAAKISENVLIVANAGVGGRTIIEADSWIGFGATLRNGIRVENNARANMGSVVTKDVMENESVTGNFAVPHEKFIRKLKKENVHLS